MSRTTALRLATFAAVAVLLFIGPSGALAHSLDTTYQSRLPLVVYLIGAAMAVALSFAFLLLADVRADPPPAPGPGKLPPAWLRNGLRAVGLIGWAWIVLQGIFGGESNGDVSTLFLWVYGWVGVAAVSALVGPIWFWLDPFATLFDIGAAVARRLGIRGWDAADYPAWLGRWPAVVGLVFFVWLELVGDGGGPSLLFIVLVGYTTFTLAMMAQFGRDAWRRDGETFSVWFRLLNRLAPIGLVDDKGHVQRRSFASGLLSLAGPRPTSCSSPSGRRRSSTTGCPRQRRGSQSSGRRPCRSRRSNCSGFSASLPGPRWRFPDWLARPRPGRGCCRSRLAT